MSVLLTLALAWLAVNLFHGLWLACRRWHWEKRIARDANGLLPQADAYTRGNGSVALLFVHGFADTPMLWSPMIDYITAKRPDFTCRAMRLPGAGEPLSVARRATLEVWQQALEREIALLRSEHAQVWLVGHSMGAALSIRATVRHPDQVQGLVLFAPLMKVSSAKTYRVPPELGFRLAQGLLALSPVFESMFAWKPCMPDNPDFTYVRDRFVPFQVYRNLFKLIRLNKPCAGMLRAPLFAALSPYDRVIDSTTAEAWLKQAASTRKVIRWTETGHVIPMDPGWQALTEEMLSFICLCL